MDALISDFTAAYNSASGYLLAATLLPTPSIADPARLYNFYRSSSPFNVQTDLKYKLQYNPELRLDRKEAIAWLDIFCAYHVFVGKLLAAEDLQSAFQFNEVDWAGVYDAWKEVSSAISKGYQANVFAAWTIPCIYVAGKYLRIFAIKADEKTASKRDAGLTFGDLPGEEAQGSANANEKLEDAARLINRLFSLCINDRNPLEDSRKWALYYIANLLFKTYFKLDSVSLCKNILRSLQASTNDMPPLSVFPKSHQVTFKYYNGVIHFLQEDYAAAEEFLVSAYASCSRKATRNLELILTYLIPTRMLTSNRLPKDEFLQPYPKIRGWFSPISAAIRNGDVVAFNAALEAGEDEFVKRRIYVTLERGRNIIMRNLLRKVFIAGGFEPAKEGVSDPPARRTRVPINEFAAAMVLAGADVGDGNGSIDSDAVECVVVNLVSKGLMKGYVAHERGVVVLSKAGAFPGTGV